MIKSIHFKPIGVVYSPFKQPKGTPIQSSAATDVEGTVEIFKEYSEGLTDLEGFSHIFLIYYFHEAKRAQSKSLLVRPFMDDNLHGVFATRTPSRPNPIGISVVRLLGIKSNTLMVKGVDIINGTPLIDVKPYVPQFDIHKVARIGWLDQNIQRLAETKDDSRFSK